MPAGATWEGSERLQKNLQAMYDATRPGSRARASCQRDVLKLVKDGHRDGVLAGTDRHGKPLAPLAESTLKRRRARGVSGTTPFATRGTASSAIRDFAAFWQPDSANRMTLIAKFEGAAAKWIGYHRAGGKKLPRRDILGLRPATARAIEARFKRLADDIRRQFRGG